MHFKYFYKTFNINNLQQIIDQDFFAFEKKRFFKTQVNTFIGVYIGVSVKNIEFIFVFGLTIFTEG